MSGFGDTITSAVLVYNISVDWQIKPQHYSASLAVSNNQIQLTPFGDPSFRFSYIGRFGSHFYKGMSITLEGGYQPFYDRYNNNLNYNEMYATIRYSCDIGKLFVKADPEEKKIK